jgi:hypothetical protein
MAVSTTRSPSGRLIASRDKPEPGAGGSLNVLDCADYIGLGARGADTVHLLRHGSGDALAHALPSARDDGDLTIEPELLQRHTRSS